MKTYSIHKFLLLFLLLFCVIKIQAQTKDSIFINKIIDSVYSNQSDSEFAFSRIDQAMVLSKKIQYADGVVSAMQLKAYLLFQYGQLDSAKVLFFESSRLTSNLKNQKVIAQNYRLLAIYYEGTDNIEKALELLFRSLVIRKQIGDAKGEAGCYISIGVCFQRILQYRKAVFYYKKALAYFEPLNSLSAISSIYSNLGSIYTNWGKIDSSIFFLNKVIKIKKNLNDGLGLAKAYHNIGTAYLSKGEYTKALDYYRKGISLAGGGEKNFNNAGDYAMIGSIFYQLDQLEEAEKYLLLAEKLFRFSGNFAKRIEVCDNLGSLYESKKNFSKAVEYRVLSNMLDDSLAQVRNRMLVVEYETKYQSIEKQRQNDLLTAENNLLESEARNNTFLLIFLIILIGVSLGLAYNLRVIRHSKNKLQLQHEIIATQNNEMANINTDLGNLIEENQAIMGILAHDLRSPFAKISGLINLLKEEENETEKSLYINYITGICKDSLQLIQDTIDISEIFRDKKSQTATKTENFAPSEVMLNLTNSFMAVAKDKNIAIEINNSLEGLTINNSKEFLNRVLDNLLSNAIKFSSNNSKIVFSATSTHNKVIFSVKDNGPGFSDSDKQQLFMRFKKLSARPTGNEASSGLGLFIVKQLTNLMQGDIDVISEQGEGTEFILSIPFVLATTA